MSIYEEVELEDLDYDESEQIYYYPCPCGDRFRITLEELWDGEDVAGCPSCTLRIEIIYEEEDLPELLEEYTDDDEEEGEGGGEEVIKVVQEKKEKVGEEEKKTDDELARKVAGLAVEG